MPGLLRGLVRTAVVAGTASAVAGRVQRHQARKFAAVMHRSPRTGSGPTRSRWLPRANTRRPPQRRRLSQNRT